MKKNRTMRIAAVMMVLALITTCIISGSFAKYVTGADAASDDARVAAWGVTVIADSELELFKTSYTKDDRDTSIAVTVSADDAVVAPGTTNTGVAAVTLSGTPEVAVRVAYTGSFEVTGWEANGAFYCPLKITVGSTVIDGTNMTKDAFENAVNAALNTTQDYAVGTDLSTLNAGKQVSWEWVFYVSEDNDIKDTALGNLANAPTVSLSLSATVTQID